MHADYCLNEELVKEFKEELGNWFLPLNKTLEIPVFRCGKTNEDRVKTYPIEIKIGDFKIIVYIIEEDKKAALKEKARNVAMAYWEFNGHNYTTRLGKMLFLNH